jgi:DNA-directed RNA polymerase specialized sigma24 family protein
MTDQSHNGTDRDGSNRYATCEDFLKTFDEDLHGLYQLSFLLAGDHQRAEKCFGAGIESCVKANWVFRERARAWAKRMIVESAIRELNPRRQRSNSSALLPTVLSHDRQSSGHFDLYAMLGLADFERFVFVLCVLERYRVHECALLLGCSASEVREACTQAIEKLANFGQSDSNRCEDRERGGAEELEPQRRFSAMQPRPALRGSSTIGVNVSFRKD